MAANGRESRSDQCRYVRKASRAPCRVACISGIERPESRSERHHGGRPPDRVCKRVPERFAPVRRGLLLFPVRGRIFQYEEQERRDQRKRDAGVEGYGDFRVDRQRDCSGAEAWRPREGDPAYVLARRYRSGVQADVEGDALPILGDPWVAEGWVRKVCRLERVSGPRNESVEVQLLGVQRVRDGL